MDRSRSIGPIDRTIARIEKALENTEEKCTSTNEIRKNNKPKKTKKMSKCKLSNNHSYNYDDFLSCKLDVRNFGFE